MLCGRSRSFSAGRRRLDLLPLVGFTFLASVIIIFSGAQLFTLGIIGEYLARMHFRMMDRPPYVVRTVVDSSSLTGKEDSTDEVAGVR